MIDSADSSTSAEQQQQQQQQQPQQQQPQPADEPVLDIRPSISDLVTLDVWGAAKSGQEEELKTKEERKKEERRNREDREKEERRREREWKMEQDSEIRRKERRREDYKEAQRRHYRGYQENKKFSWDATRSDDSYKNNVPPVESHFGRYRLTRDNRPATYERPDRSEWAYGQTFKKTWSRHRPEQIVNISRNKQNDADDSGRRRRNETGNSNSTLDEEDRDPRRKRKD